MDSSQTVEDGTMMELSAITDISSHELDTSPDSLNDSGPQLLLHHPADSYTINYLRKLPADGLSD
jgi:hypothetical protein